MAIRGRERWVLCIGGMLLCMQLSCKPPVLTGTMRIKLEWGVMVSGDRHWSGRIKLKGARLMEAQPYVLEVGDDLEPATLEFAGTTESGLTDGMLLALEVSDSSRLVFDSSFGRLDANLFGLEIDEARFYTLADGAYVEISSITDDEWNTALSYNTRPTNRSDAMPERAYDAYVARNRPDSRKSEDDVVSGSQAAYASDAFAMHAEDLRQAVSQQLYVTVPSVVGVGESFDVTVAAFDLYGHRVTDFGERVTLSVEGEGDLSVPVTVEFAAGQESLVTLPEAGYAQQAGYVRITAIDPSGRFAPGSIPVRIEQDPSERVYWGDLHTHSNLSDGDFGDLGPDEVYRFGRDVGRLDFQAVSDHDYRRPIPDWKWPIEKAAAAEFNEPGRFATLLAYEWSAEDIRFADGIGHKNVYFRDGDGPVYSAWDPRYNTAEKLWAALRAEPGVGKVLTIPHHPVRRIDLTEEHPWYGGVGTDWRAHDEELQPLVEVYSRWGISEFTGSDNPRPVRDARNTGSAQYAVGLGYRLGFMASSDTHDGTPGVSVVPSRETINAYPVGMVAVFAPALTREDVFDALEARRCYGTSGARRMLLELATTTGVRAGESGTVAGPPTFSITVAGTTSLQELSLLRVDDLGEATTVWREQMVDWLEQVTVSDPEFSGEAAYYLRVTQDDDELGWIGPVFLSSE